MQFQAGALHRILACNGSIGMGDDHLPMPAQTEEAIEGIAAHYVASQVLSGRFSDPVEFVDRETPSGFYVTPEMADFVSVFTNNVLARDAVSPLGFRLVETECNWAVPGTEHNIAGRVDHAAFYPELKTLRIDDFKYGYHSVDPYDNWAMIDYALSVITSHEIAPEIVILTIHQPRPFHRDGPTRKAVYSIAEIFEFAKRIVATLSALNDELHSGELQCYKCPALPICGVARNAAMNGIEASGTVFVEDIPDDALSFELDMLERAASAIETRLHAAVELATHRARSGRTIPNRVLESAQGNRKWLATTTPELLRLMTGKDLTKPKMPTLAEAKAAGLKDETITGLTERPNLGVKLARYDAAKHGRKLFNTPS